jgi:tripartite-type tricarboxylate transporter receptor subunit TctC
MNYISRARRILLLGFLGLVSLSSQAQIQTAANYPSKPIKIVVPFAAGGSTDALARLLAQKLTSTWGHTVIVENKPGAGATLGADYVTKAPADGYTLLMGAAHHTIAQNVYKTLPYHFGRDLAPVSIMALIPNVIVVNDKVPAKNIQELIALAKKEPGKLNYGSAGAGTAHHLIGAMFNLQAGVDIVHIPYKGSSPAVADLVSGQVQLMFDTVSSALPQIKAGKTRALAVTTKTRSSALPDVPTLNETVLPGFDVGTWFGILAPTATPPDIVEKLSQEIIRIVKTPEMQKQLLDMGSEPIGSTSGEMKTQITKELDEFGALTKQIKLTVD